MTLIGSALRLIWMVLVSTEYESSFTSVYQNRLGVSYGGKGGRLGEREVAAASLRRLFRRRRLLLRRKAHLLPLRRASGGHRTAEASEDSYVWLRE